MAVALHNRVCRAPSQSKCREMETDGRRDYLICKELFGGLCSNWTRLLGGKRVGCICLWVCVLREVR